MDRAPGPRSATPPWRPDGHGRLQRLALCSYFCDDRADEATVRCHRRLLKGLLVRVAARRALVIW
jgi:hypothetical protein